MMAPAENQLRAQYIFHKILTKTVFNNKKEELIYLKIKIRIEKT